MSSHELLKFLFILKARRSVSSSFLFFLLPLIVLLVPHNQLKFKVPVIIPQFVPEHTQVTVFIVEMSAYQHEKLTFLSRRDKFKNVASVGQSKHAPRLFLISNFTPLNFIFKIFNRFYTIGLNLLS